MLETIELFVKNNKIGFEFKHLETVVITYIYTYGERPLSYLSDD